MTANMYRVGDYVYFETSPSMPYQIRRIEELNKTASGNVEAKVMCYFRRRDIPPSLLVLADRHQSVAEAEEATPTAAAAAAETNKTPAPPTAEAPAAAVPETPQKVDVKEEAMEVADGADVAAAAAKTEKVDADDVEMKAAADADKETTEKAAEVAEKAAAEEEEEEEEKKKPAAAADVEMAEVEEEATTTTAEESEAKKKEAAAEAEKPAEEAEGVEKEKKEEPKDEVEKTAEESAAKSPEAPVVASADASADTKPAVEKETEATAPEKKSSPSTTPTPDVPAEQEAAAKTTAAAAAEDDKAQTEKAKKAAAAAAALAESEAAAAAVAAAAAAAAAEELTAKQKHQLNQRELFLSRQVETLPATNIRGKCSVTLLNETEAFASYLDKEDAFFYTLVYDPTQRTLLADRGEIRVGARYQAEPTPLLKEGDADDRVLAELEQLVWTPEHALTDREIDQFLVIARSVGTFSRALDCSSAVKQPSLHMSAAAASRDITLFHAMDALHASGYDLGRAMAALVPATGPTVCRDQMEEWSASEANLFEEAMEKYGKDFHDIRQDFLTWKTPSALIEYYYLWKTTDRYVQQKRVKAVEAESKLKQVYIPTYNKPHPAAIGPPAASKNGGLGLVEISLGSGKTCEGCPVTSSVQWYAWGPTGGASSSSSAGSPSTPTPTPPPPPPSSSSSSSQSRLCHLCWAHWKKYGDLKMANKTGSALVPLSAAGDVDVEAKLFGASSAAGVDALTSRQHRCANQAGAKEFKMKSHLMRHGPAGQGVPLPPGSPRPMMKTRTAFYLAVTPSTRLARRFCGHLLRPRRAARFPFVPISAAAIRQEFQLRLSRKTPAEVAALLVRAQKPLPPFKKPQRIRVADVTFRLARGHIHSQVPGWLILPDRVQAAARAAAKESRLAFPRPPKAADGSLIYERIVLPLRDAAAVAAAGAPLSTPPPPGSQPPPPLPPSALVLTSSVTVDKLKRRPDDHSPADGPAFKRVARDSPSTLAVGVGSGVTLTAASGSPTPAPAFAGLAPGLRGLVPPELYTSAGPTAPLLNRSADAKGLVARPPVAAGAGPRRHGGLHGHSGRPKQLPTWMDAPDDLFFHSTQAINRKVRRQMATQELRRAARKPWRPLSVPTPAATPAAAAAAVVVAAAAQHKPL